MLHARHLELAGLALVALTLAACADDDAAGPAAEAAGLPLTGDISPVHDPTIVMEGAVAHVFSTSQVGEAPGLIHWRSSTDLLHWTRNGAVFDALPAWAEREVPGTRGIWAPDVSMVGDEFRLYYAVSRFGENVSAIGLAVTKTLDRSDPRFGWVDKGVVLRSSATDDWNAIDPDLFVDASGRHWLSFGSFWSGIKLIELDPATGKPASATPTLYDLARRPFPDAIEAPKLIARNGRFYLFASFDYCCRGSDSSYSTVVARADAPTGPFTDAEGRPMLAGGGSTFLHADLDPTRRWAGPGHVAVLSVAGADFVAYHAYDREAGGRPTLRLQRVGWNSDGWPVAQ